MNDELYSAILGSSLDNIKKYALEAENINNKTSFTYNEGINQKVEAVINKVKLNLDLQHDLSLKHTKTVKSKI